MADPWHWLWPDGGKILVEGEPGTHWILQESPTRDHEVWPSGEPWHWLWPDGNYISVEGLVGSHWLVEESPTIMHQDVPTSSWTPVDDSQNGSWVEIPDSPASVTIRR